LDKPYLVHSALAGRSHKIVSRIHAELHVGRLLGPALLFFSLALLRLEIVSIARLSREQALASGLLRGFYFDLLVALFPSLLAWALWVSGIPRRITWPAAAFFIFLAALADMLHYKFYGARLDWWVVRLHLSDLFLVRGSAGQLGMEPGVAAGVLLMLAAVVWGASPWCRACESSSGAGRPEKGRARRLAWALVLALVCALLWLVPGFCYGRVGSDVLSDNVVHAWLRQWLSTSIYAGAGKDFFEEAARGFDKTKPDGPNRILWGYHTFEDPGIGFPLQPEAGTNRPWPLYRSVDADPAETRALRQRLGLPVDRPINVIVLFLESVRAYEILHPETGPLIFPGLRDVLANHAILFRQVYCSAFTAGQTVRGQYSTLCSSLPNITGAATYIAHSTLRTTCLQQVMADNGYETLWMNSFRADYHGKRAFETLHGTRLFFEGKDYKARGVTRRMSWGLADADFLVETLRIVQEQEQKTGKAVFANVLTISAHHPYSVVPGGPVPQRLIDANADNPVYVKYLSRLRYDDMALETFFKSFFASPIADHTLIVMLADHSSGVMPGQLLTPAEQEEVRFRIPLALITRDLPAPEVIDTPLHQADVAPGIAAIAGVRGVASWQGRGLFGGSGTPWVYQQGDRISYRTGERACYGAFQNGPLTCFDTRGKDPLFDTALNPVSEDPSMTRFFQSVVKAYMQSIALNVMEPDPSSIPVQPAAAPAAK
jgi:hypothetical protein